MCWSSCGAGNIDFWIDSIALSIYSVDRFPDRVKYLQVRQRMKTHTKRKTVQEALRVRSVAGLHRVIEYLDAMYGLEEAELIFPDGLPLAGVFFVQRELENGRKTTQVILTDEWPR